jgi:hypothetical protein
MEQTGSKPIGYFGNSHRTFPIVTGIDPEVCNAIELGQTFWCSDLKKMDDELGGRIMEALVAVATDTLKRTIAGWRPHD